ncbi:MAG: RluA family pseudouridine synthase [Acidobacteriota bacterium]|nr:RluA family pseudouridine synthase [Acidobacteriota bacterium]
MYWTVPLSDSGARLDSLISRNFPEHSRSRVQEWIRAERVLVNGQPVTKPSLLVKGGERIEMEPAAPPPLRASPEAIPLRILYEDDDLAAVDKPSGMVVHAGAGVHSGTLVNALLHRFNRLSSVGGEIRPGIVHRLDRFTSGVLLVAKHDRAHRELSRQFAARQVRKLYLAMVNGTPVPSSARIEKPIARDPNRRDRMTSRLSTGRAAWSEYSILERFPQQSFLQVLIGTGRTHQIRVHLAGIGHPIVGDKLYGAPSSTLNRYFLHSYQIEFHHPSSGQSLTVTSPLPEDLESWKTAAGHTAAK